MGTMGIYKPLYVWCSPASIPQIVAHIQDYLVKNPIVSTETVAEIVVQSLQEHPELINGSVIPITEDSAQTIKEYIDALPSLDGYTKAETDALLLLKQNLLTWDQTPTAGSSNPVTSEGIKAAISATAAALADLISTKADIASVYTKSVMDTLLIQKADVATTYSKNAVDALLDTKVDINDTYTKADIDLMKQVDKANTAIVSSTDGTAPLNIAAGQYVYLNDILYMATQAIPEDDPLVPGTNIVLTPKGVTNNIGDGLQALARTVGEQSDQIANKANAIANAHQTTYGTDLNNYTETGMYGIQGATNYPAEDSANQYGTLTVNRYSNTDYVTQIWQTMLSNQAWIRIKNNGTWSAWNKLALADQIVALGPYNGLDSTSTTAALSAAQGKALNDQIGNLTYSVHVTSAATVGTGVTVNSLNLIYYPNIKIAYLEFNITLAQRVNHNDVILTMPETVPSARMSMNTDMSAVNATSIAGRAVYSGRSLYAFGAIAPTNYLNGSIAFPIF